MIYEQTGTVGRCAGEDRTSAIVLDHWGAWVDERYTPRDIAHHFNRGHYELAAKLRRLRTHLN